MASVSRQTVSYQCVLGYIPPHCLSYLKFWLKNHKIRVSVDLVSSHPVHNLYFSVVTSATPGYGGYKPEPGGFQILATIQAIFGTFMWAAFIVTFARKFMR
ncbi:ion channel [Chloroflexota bacterium]